MQKNYRLHSEYCKYL